MYRGVGGCCVNVCGYVHVQDSYAVWVYIAWQQTHVLHLNQFIHQGDPKGCTKL